VFANTLCGEYQALANELDFTKAELAKIAKNGWAVADVSAAARKQAIAAIDRLLP